MLIGRLGRDSDLLPASLAASKFEKIQRSDWQDLLREISMTHITKGEDGCARPEFNGGHAISARGSQPPLPAVSVERVEKLKWLHLAIIG